jgi:hypothetical protein
MQCSWISETETDGSGTLGGWNEILHYLLLINNLKGFHLPRLHKVSIQYNLIDQQSVYNGLAPRNIM